MTREHGGAISEVRLAEGRVGIEVADPDSDLLAHFFGELREYFDGERDRFTVPWRLDALSKFSSDVLTELSGVGFGETVSYGELAGRAGYPGAARAAGNALNKNPLLILVPCHRVIAADGTMGGFGSGLDCKRALHAVEGIGPLNDS